MNNVHAFMPLILDVILVILIIKFVKTNKRVPYSNNHRHVRHVLRFYCAKRDKVRGSTSRKVNALG